MKKLVPFTIASCALLVLAGCGGPKEEALKVEPKEGGPKVSDEATSSDAVSQPQTAPMTQGGDPGSL